MSMELSTFKTFSGDKQARKSPLNVLVVLFQPTCDGDISAVKITQTFSVSFQLCYTQKEL